MNTNAQKNDLSSLIEKVANAGHARILSPSPAAERIQELEAAVVELRQALKEVGQEASSGVCCCGDPMASHSLASCHAPLDRVHHYIDQKLERTADLVKGH